MAKFLIFMCTFIMFALAFAVVAYVTSKIYLRMKRDEKKYEIDAEISDKIRNRIKEDRKDA